MFDKQAETMFQTGLTMISSSLPLPPPGGPLCWPVTLPLLDLAVTCLPFCLLPEHQITIANG